MELPLKHLTVEGDGTLQALLHYVVHEGVNYDGFAGGYPQRHEDLPLPRLIKDEFQDGSKVANVTSECEVIKLEDVML